MSLIEDLRPYIRGGMVGIAIGDAMGMPVEMMTKSQISAIGGVCGFLDPIQRKIPETWKLKAGEVTDDTILTVAVAESLIRRGEFDLSDLALGHVAAFEGSTVGWGRTTGEGIAELKEYFDTRGVSGRSPHSVRVGGGGGNGVAMKILPLAMFKILNLGSERKISKYVEELGGLTHSDSRSWLTAYFLCTIGELILNDRMVGEKYRIFINDPIHSKKLDELMSDVLDFESEYEGLMGAISSKIVLMQNPEFLFGDLEFIRKSFGTGCHCLESVPFSVAVALRNIDDFRKGVLEAVNSGGDADTCASMVGGLIGMNVGIDHIPSEWINFNPYFQEIIELADNFCDRIGRK